MNCPKCASSFLVKIGFQNGKQRYKCKDCNRTSTEYAESRGYSIKIKKKAYEYYCMRYSFRRIGRLLGVSDVSIGKWILKKQIGSLFPNPMVAERLLKKIPNLSRDLKKNPLQFLS